MTTFIIFIAFVVWLASLTGYGFYRTLQEKFSELERDMVDTNDSTTRFLSDRIDAVERDIHALNATTLRK